LKSWSSLEQEWNGTWKLFYPNTWRWVTVSKSWHPTLATDESAWIKVTISDTNVDFFEFCTKKIARKIKRFYWASPKVRTPNYNLTCWLWPIKSRLELWQPITINHQFENPVQFFFSFGSYLAMSIVDGAPKKTVWNHHVHRTEFDFIPLHLI